jgi:hypothetical protein
MPPRQAITAMLSETTPLPLLVQVQLLLHHNMVLFSFSFLVSLLT